MHKKDREILTETCVEELAKEQGRQGRLPSNMNSVPTARITPPPTAVMAALSSPPYEMMLVGQTAQQWEWAAISENPHLSHGGTCSATVSRWQKRMEGGPFSLCVVPSVLLHWCGN